MSCRSTSFASVLLLFALSLGTQAGDDFFERRIRPILVDNCEECHGPEKQKGSLRLDSKPGWMRGGDSGQVIVPGKPDDSLLVNAVRYWDKSLQMPPKHALEVDEVNDLIAWVKQGAVDPREVEPAGMSKKAVAQIDLTKAREHWAFRRVQIPPVPEVKDAAWPRNDVDRFLLAAMEKSGVRPTGDADRATLLRRVSYDLTGLPPTPEEVSAFQNDQGPDAFAQTIERLLASPRYGERWGRHWLDVARYADTCGNASDYPVPQAYRYRNYVIQAFNEDVPFDRFIREQLAGDLLPAESDEQRNRQIVATGYLAGTRHFAGGNGEPHLTIEDAIENMGRAFLGMSLSCARCHDHKFDPIPTRDYYALYGIFSSTKFPHPGSEGKNRPENLVPLVAEVEVTKLEQERKEKLAVLDGEINVAVEAKAAATKEPESPERKAKIDRATQAENAAKARRKELADKALYPTAYAVSDRKGEDTRLQVRGDPKRLGDVVPRGFLQVLGDQKLPPGSHASGRLELARWIGDPDNPLTARVLVNRLWQHHFGRGLVGTPNDFGTRGQAPTHPELLDFLARRFVASGWSIKAMHRLILNSRAWQLSSAGDESSDPGNVLWARADRRRLDAESIRDGLLQVSGDLDLTPGGEHPFPPVHTWGFTQHNQFFALYDTKQRAVYQMQQRLRKHPFFALFDGADTNSSTATRSLSTTPLQSLFVMNDPFIHERATRLSAVLSSAATDDAKRIERAFLTLYGRYPESEEVSMGVAYLDRVSAKRTRDQAWMSFCRVLLSANEFLYLD